MTFGIKTKAAIDMVRGGATYAEAALETRMPLSHIKRACESAGVKLTPEARKRTYKDHVAMKWKLMRAGIE